MWKTPDKWVEEMRDLREKGMSTQAIVAHMTKQGRSISYSTVHSILGKKGKRNKAGSPIRERERERERERKIHRKSHRRLKP